MDFFKIDSVEHALHLFIIGFGAGVLVYALDKYLVVPIESKVITSAAQTGAVAA